MTENTHKICCALGSKTMERTEKRKIKHILNHSAIYSVSVCENWLWSPFTMYIVLIPKACDLLFTFDIYQWFGNIGALLTDQKQKKKSSMRKVIYFEDLFATVLFKDGWEMATIEIQWQNDNN